MDDKKANKKENERINNNGHQFYSVMKDFVIPIIAIVISIVAISQSYQAVRDTKTNNDLINNYTVNLNKPTFNFKYHYGESKDVITGIDIENEGTSLSTNTIKISPYLEILLRNNKSEEDYLQQDDVLLVKNFLFETILVPVGRDVFDVEYYNNRTGILATISQNSSYEKLIKEIEECDEILKNGEKIISIRLKCYVNLQYRDLNNKDDTETVKWNTGYVKKCSDSNYYLIEDEDVGVVKIEDKGKSDYNYIVKSTAGSFIPDSGQSLKEKIEICRGIDRSGFITIEVKRLDQRRFSKQIVAEPGDIVQFRVHLENTTDNQLSNWSIRIIPPTNLEYIKGKSYVANSTNPNGVRISDNICNDYGSNIGNYNPGSNAYIYFFARVGKDAKKKDNIIYRMIAQCSAGTVTGTIEDNADVIVRAE